MDQGQLLRLVNELTGNILPRADQTPAEIESLQRAVIDSLLVQSDAATGRTLRFENLDEFSTEALSEKTSAKLSNLVREAAKSLEASGEEQPFYKVYRREFPIVSSQIEGSIPSWGRGALIEKTLGPYVLSSGRRVWFDFFRVTRLIGIYFGKEATPTLLIPLQPRVRVIDRSYTIQPGSAWIRSNRLCGGLAANLYTGFLIKGGRLDFSQRAPISEDKIRIAATDNVSLTLNLVQPEIADQSPDKHGADLKHAALQLPARLSITLSMQSNELQEGSPAKMSIYGNQFDLKARKQAAYFNTSLNRIFIPYDSATGEISISKIESPFLLLRGHAQILRSAWALTTAAIDLSAPPAAAGIGGMVIEAGTGLSASWRGLKDLSGKEKGSVELYQPLILLEPGRICISDQKAPGINIRQNFRLWTNENTGQRSMAQLNFPKQFPLIYNCYQKGDESVSTIANLEAEIDRPLKVDGYPFSLKSKNSLFLLGSSEAVQLVYILDNDLLADSLSSPNAEPAFSGESIALENALLTVSPAVSFGLFGELLDEEHFDKAILLMAFGLLGYLPILPDPYAANTRIFNRRGKKQDERGRIIYTPSDYSSLLIAMCGWQALEGNAEKQPPILSFHFGHLPGATRDSRVEAINDLRKLSKEIKAAPADSSKISIAKNKTLTKQLVSQVAAIEEAESKAAAVRYRNMPEVSDSFALLDLSTNADLMGVSFGVTNDDFIFYKTRLPNPQVPAGQPIQVQGMNVVAPGKFVRAFTSPLISWEPVMNITEPPPGNPNNDPNIGLLLFPNDGGPSRIFSTSVELVPIAPLPVTDYIVRNATERPELPAWSIFTLPFGLRALAILYKDSFFIAGDNDGQGAKLSFNQPKFPDNIQGGLQLKMTSAAHPRRSSSFEGMSFQESNLVSTTGSPTGQSMLGYSVTQIFNAEFTMDGPRTLNGVPLERIDISGYGASIFSNWLNNDAAFAKTSQARFDVFRGRTAHEVIQVRSVIYPWGVTVVRTITMHRAPSGFVYRHDSGWQAEGEGIYDFSYLGLTADFTQTQRIESPFVFHPGIVRGVFNVRNIEENSQRHFETSMSLTAGQQYVDPSTGRVQTVPAGGLTYDVHLVPVWFDADARIDFVTDGAPGNLVPSKKMLGYVQLKPQGQPITAESFRALLDFCGGSLGGPVDCLVDIGKTGQKIRISRIDVNASADSGNQPIFATAARGAVVLPKDGSWSIVEHKAATDEITPVSKNSPVPLLKEGILQFDASRNQLYPSYETGRFKIANPYDLLKNANDAAISYGFLQNTDTQKVLFKNPEYKKDDPRLLLNQQSVPKIADAYRLMNSPGIFPKLQDVLDLKLDDAEFDMKIIEAGYELLNRVDPLKKFEQILPNDISWFLVNEEKIKIYIEYESKDKNGSSKGKGSFKYDLNSQAAKWVNKLNDITMVVDLLDMKRILLIRGKFDTEKGREPSFLGPELEFGKDLQPIVDILQILEMLAFEPDYSEILKKGLKIVMSNSPENWEYKFQADKEIPVVKFPPARLDGPTTPLRLEAGMKVGCYFNMALPFPPGSGVTAPSAGAFIEFGAKLSVMCVSVAAATIYAVGAANLKVSADTRKGPMLDMKFSFAAELMVGLPVIGNVSISFGAGVIIHLSNDEVVVGALIFFKGRAEILGGIVTISIFIEAAGKVQRIGDRTNCIAQVVFALDISICFVIDLSFEERWQETKQIA